MIVDTSALIAILRKEPEAPAFARAIAGSPATRLSAVSYVEAGAVLDRAGEPSIARMLDRLLETAAIEVAPVTTTQAVVARAAYRDFGKGSGHPAGLNFGDCFAYALAVEAGEPLLFKGDDFGHTDVELPPLRPDTCSPGEPGPVAVACFRSRLSTTGPGDSRVSLPSGFRLASSRAKGRGSRASPARRGRAGSLSWPAPSHGLLP